MMRPLPVVAAIVAFVVLGCGDAGLSGSPSPAMSPASSPTTSLAAQATRAEIVEVLGSRSIGVEDARSPYRPPESALVASAPRLVLETFLPDDPTAGRIVVYEFPTASDAGSAGREMAHYIGSGPGRVNFTPDAVFVLRELGPTLIFYTYAPGSLKDPTAAAAVAEALSTIGSAIPVQG
jgi:hypothetical protein